MTAPAICLSRTRAGNLQYCSSTFHQFVDAVGDPLRALAQPLHRPVRGVALGHVAWSRNMATGTRVRSTGLSAEILGDHDDAAVWSAWYRHSSTWPRRHLPKPTRWDLHTNVLRTRKNASSMKVLYRLLKPDARMVDWGLTDRYKDADERHRNVRERIEKGNLSSNLLRTHEQVEAVQSPGFEVVTTADQHAEGDPRSPWYLPTRSEHLSASLLPVAGTADNSI